MYYYLSKLWILRTGYVMCKINKSVEGLLKYLQKFVSYTSKILKHEKQKFFKSEGKAPLLKA